MGMGGFSTLGFYWQYSWEELIPDKIADIRSKQLSINVLELVAIVVNFFATATYFNIHPTSGGWAPKVHCGGDNSSADSWYKRFTNANMIARTLTQLLARGQMETNLDMDVTWLAGEGNFFPDALSRGNIKDTIKSKFKDLCKTNEQLISYLQVHPETKRISFSRFQMSKELESWICSAIYQTNTTLLPKLNKTIWAPSVENRTLH